MGYVPSAHLGHCEVLRTFAVVGALLGEHEGYMSIKIVPDHSDFLLQKRRSIGAFGYINGDIGEIYMEFGGCVSIQSCRITQIKQVVLDRRCSPWMRMLKLGHS